MPSTARHLLGRLVRASIRGIAAWGALYLVVFLLLALAYLDSATRGERLPVRFSPLPGELDDPEVELRGEADRFFWLQIEINGRRESELWPIFGEEEGGWSRYLRLPPGTRELRAVVLSQWMEEIGTIDLPIRWVPGAFPVEASFCLASEALGLLWIAGTGTPGEIVVVEGEPATEIARAALDPFGVVDLLIEWDGEPPERVTLRGDATERSASSSACRVLPEDEPLPLGREVVVDLERDLPGLLDRFRSSIGADPSRRASDVFLELLPETRVTVSLPSEHPYVRLMTAGLMPVDSFLERTVGDLEGVPDPRMLASYGSWFERAGLGKATDLEPRARVWLKEASARVEVRLRLFTFSPREQTVRWSPGIGDGVAARPLLTPRDAFSLRTAPSDRWTFGTTPTAIDPELAVWRGPLELEEIAASREFPRGFEQQLAAGGADRQPAENATMRDLFQTLERIEGLGPWRHLWHTLLALVPAAALAWLLRRHRPYSTMVGRSRLLAFSALAAALLATSLIHRTVLGLARPVLGASVSSMLAHVSQDPLPTSRILELQEVGRGLPDDAFWLVVAALVGALPLYFGGLAWRVARRPSEPPPRALWRRTLAAGAFLYVAAGLAWLWVLTGLPKGLAELFPWAAAQGVLRLFEAPENRPELLLPGSLVVLVSAAALLLAAGWRGLVFASTCWLAALALVHRERLLGEALAPELGLVVLLVAGLAAIPLLIRTLGAVLPVAWVRRGRGAVALVIPAAALLFHELPPGAVLLAGAGALGLGLLWATSGAFAQLVPRLPVGRHLARHPILFAVPFAVAGIALGYPLAAPGEELDPARLSDLVFHWRKVLPSFLGVGLALLLWRRQRGTGRRLLGSAELLGAAVLYAAFLVGPTTTWLGLVPVPLLVASAIGRSGLFLPETARAALLPLDRGGGIDTRRAARAFVEAEVPRRRVEAAVQSLTKELEQAKLTPQEYEKRVAEYRDFWAPAEEPHPSAVAFTLGDRDFTASVLAFLRIGLLLATGPIVISLYQYLPVSRVSYPFPVADFLTFLLTAVLKWGLYAAFFGLLFANLRGQTGLTKGLHLFLAIGIPFLTYRLLGAESLGDLRPFAFWITQLFVFFGLLGVLAGDLRLLRLAGLPAGRLRLVHRLPALYAFGSTVAAAILPTFLAAVAGRFGEAVKFFMEMVIPGANSP